MGASEGRCASCCLQEDANSQDFVALKPSGGGPGLDTRKAAPAAATPASHAATAEEPAEPPRAPDFDIDGAMAPWPVSAPTAAVEPEDVHETYEDGSTYDGQIIGGERHGKGAWKSQQESYEGEWNQDARHGAGTQSWEDGRLYVGKFRDGKFHGFGRMEWSTPQGMMAYEGEYCDDVKHGEGKYCWPDGRIYDGQWVDGARTGKATLINPRGDRRQGMWKADKLERWIEDGDENK